MQEKKCSKQKFNKTWSFSFSLAVSALYFVAYFPNPSDCQEGNFLLKNILVIYCLSLKSRYPTISLCRQSMKSSGFVVDIKHFTCSCVAVKLDSQQDLFFSYFCTRVQLHLKDPDTLSATEYSYKSWLEKTPQIFSATLNGNMHCLLMYFVDYWWDLGTDKLVKRKSNHPSSPIQVSNKIK